MNAFHLLTDTSVRQAGNPALASAIPAMPTPRTALPLHEQPAKDSFEPSHKPKQPTPWGAMVAGTVVLAGLVGAGIWQRENIARWWEQLFSKHTAATPEVTPQLPNIVEPSILNNNESVAGLPEALRLQWEALPAELKPDLTAYDLTNPEQFNELRIYVEGLHELREKPDAKTLCTAINKICTSLGGNADDCAWISRAQARRLTGTMENGKPIGKDIDPNYPSVDGYSLVPSNYSTMATFGQRVVKSAGEPLFQQKFALEDTVLGTGYNRPNPNPDLSGEVFTGRSYSQVEALLKQEENGSLFLLYHNPWGGTNEGHATVLANINGDIYFVDNAMEGTFASTFDDFFQEKQRFFDSLPEENKRTPNKIFTKDTVLNLMTSELNLRIRKFKDLKIHPWLLNQSS